MDLKEYLVLKSFADHEVGEKITLTDEVGTPLIDAGILKLCATAIDPDAVDEAVDEAFKALGDQIEKKIAEGIQGVIIQLKDSKGPHIEIVEPTEDPKGGFKNMAHFAHDIWKAGPGMHRPSEALQKYMDREGKAATGHMTESEGSEGVLGQIINRIGVGRGAPGDPVADQGIVLVVEVVPREGAAFDDGTAKEFEAQRLM